MFQLNCILVAVVSAHFDVLRYYKMYRLLGSTDFDNESILDGTARWGFSHLHFSEGNEKPGHPVQISCPQTLWISIPQPGTSGGKRRRLHVSRHLRTRTAWPSVWFLTCPLLCQSIRVGQWEENCHTSRELPDSKGRRQLWGHYSETTSQKGTSTNLILGMQEWWVLSSWWVA